MDWKALKREWPNSGADWNRMRAAISRFLTMYLDDKYHPFRREVVKAILSQAGEPEAMIQASLRHADPAMTRRYTRQRDRGETARTMERALFPEPVEAEEDAG